MADFLVLCIGLNIVSQLVIINKAHEKVTRRDYLIFLYQSLFITAAMVMARYVYRTFEQMIG